MTKRKTVKLTVGIVLIFGFLVTGFSITKNINREESNFEISKNSAEGGGKDKNENLRSEKPISKEDEPLKNEIPEKEEKIEYLNGVAVGERRKLNVKTQAQRKWFWCAPTTVSMILSSRGIDISQEQLAQEMGTFEPFGTHNEDAVKVLNRHMFGYDFPRDGQAGYRLERVNGVNSTALRLFKDRLMKNTKDGYPMYYTIDLGVMYEGSKSAEHNVAGAGYIATPDGNDVALVYFVDPYSKFHDDSGGGLKIVTPEKLLKATTSKNVTEPYYAW